MATSLTSDTFYDVFCTPCSDEDKNSEASAYCVNCEKFFCKSCLKVHNGVPEAKQHHFVDKADFQHGVPTSAIATPSNFLTEKCSRHCNKTEDMYCGVHGEICCSVCIAIGHRSCSDVAYIPDVAKSLISDKSIHKVNQGLFENIRDLVRLKQNRLDHKARLKNEKETRLAETDEKMGAIIKHVKALGTAFRRDIMNRYDELTDKLRDDAMVCDESITTLESIERRLQTDTVGANASQMFVDLKRAEALVKDTEVKLEQFKSNRNGLLKITLKAKNDVIDVLSSEAVFGRLYPGHETPVQTKPTESINVQIKSDKSACYITDLCFLSDGTIIVSDFHNGKLKSLQYDSDIYQVFDSLSLSGNPWGVCSLDGDEVAVTVPDQYRVHVVYVGKTMKIRKAFKVDHQCHGIAYADSCLYISHYYDSKLTVYDIDGCCLQTIFRDHHGAALFARPRNICVLPRHGQIAVADKDKGVVVVDMTGNLVTRYTFPDMKHTHSVCVDGHGTMYIADSGSKDIVVLSVEESFTSLRNNNHDYPLLVKFGARTNMLVVTFRGNHHIHMISLDY